MGCADRVRQDSQPIRANTSSAHASGHGTASHDPIPFATSVIESIQFFLLAQAARLRMCIGWSAPMPM